MAAITENQLAEGFKKIYDDYSNNPNIDPDEARELTAKRQASLIAQFVQQRETKVTGVTSDGKTVTGNGIIQ